MSDWEDFCESMKIDPHDPDQFDRLLDSWSRDERRPRTALGASIGFQAFLEAHADPKCPRCRGLGSIEEFQRVERGRCFACFPYDRWKALIPELQRAFASPSREMRNVYQFPVNLRQEIREGVVSEGTRDLIRRVLVELREFHPNSWDRKFCEDMLSTSKELSGKQSEQLERILFDILVRTEHPSVTPKFDFE
jgi:hypothetical protein